MKYVKLYSHRVLVHDYCIAGLYKCAHRSSCGTLIDCFIVFLFVDIWHYKANIITCVHQDKLLFERPCNINGSLLFTSTAITWHENQLNLCNGTPFWAVAHELAEPESMWWRTLSSISHLFQSIIEVDSQLQMRGFECPAFISLKACIKCLLVVNNWCD